jgi:hypothetical protein
MVQLRGDADFTQESLTAQDSGEFGTHDLERYLSLVFEIVGEVDGRHAADTDLVLDGVTVGECRR